MGTLTCIFLCAPLSLSHPLSLSQFVSVSLSLSLCSYTCHVMRYMNFENMQAALHEGNLEKAMIEFLDSRRFMRSTEFSGCGDNRKDMIWKICTQIAGDEQRLLAQWAPVFERRFASEAKMLSPFICSLGDRTKT